MTGKSFTRRGFLGLTAAAGRARTHRLHRRRRAGARPAAARPVRDGLEQPARLHLRGRHDHRLLKAQVKTFDEQNGTTTTVDALPGSGAAVYPDKLRTELLGGSGPDVWRIWGGQIGAARSSKAKQASI